MAEVVDLRPREPDGPFVVGSIVALKGGGEFMTVRKPSKQSVLVDWHNSNGDLWSSEFPPAMLRHADPDEETKEESK